MENIDNQKRIKKESIINSLMKAGYERAVSVYNSYLEDASNIDENE